MKISIDLIICLSGIFLLLLINLFFFLKIRPLKKSLEKTSPLKKDPKHFYKVIIFSIILALLPIFIPLDRRLIVLLEAASCTATFAILKERLENLKSSKKDQP